jgi:hypothetical protein
VIGQFNGDEITKLELPIQNDPIQLINELKICVCAKKSVLLQHENRKTLLIVHSMGVEHSCLCVYRI